MGIEESRKCGNCSRVFLMSKAKMIVVSCDHRGGYYMPACPYCLTSVKRPLPVTDQAAAEILCAHPLPKLFLAPISGNTTLTVPVLGGEISVVLMEGQTVTIRRHPVADNDYFRRGMM